MTKNIQTKAFIASLVMAITATMTLNIAANAATKPAAKPATKPAAKVAPKPAVSTTQSASQTTTPAAPPQAAPNTFSIALIGDMPYDALGVTQVPYIINEINASKIEFTLFGGDTMSGKGDKCTDEAYPALKTNFFNKFSKQIFYTIGDNEWVDCDRPVKGAFDPLTRLELVRSNYFGKNGAYINLGTTVLNLPGTSTPVTILHDTVYPEMQMFTYKGITVIIPHIPGSANNMAIVDNTKCKTYNDLEKDGDAAEFAARDAANVLWINKGFGKAYSDNALGVIVLTQANMDWEGYLAGQAMPNTECTSAYNADKQALLTNTLQFKKPVLLQNGDEHWFQLDMPMNETAGKLVQKDKGSMVENFTRVQTFGSAFNHWVELVVDPSSSTLWSFKTHIVKENIANHGQ
ncbi:MAG: hypothetical protein WCI68_05765 [Actinomycetes bacterium]